MLLSRRFTILQIQNLGVTVCFGFEESKHTTQNGHLCNENSNFGFSSLCSEANFSHTQELSSVLLSNSQTHNVRLNVMFTHNWEIHAPISSRLIVMYKKNQRAHTALCPLLRKMTSYWQLTSPMYLSP